MQTKTQRPKRADRAEVARNDQVIRILNILREIDRAGGCDLYELAERHGTTTRTIRRDLEALEAAGFPLVRELDDSNRARFSIDSDVAHRITRLVDASHYLALRMAMEGSAAIKKSSLFHTLEDMARRVEDALGPQGRSQLRAFEHAFISWEKFAWRNAPPDVMWMLVDAIAEKRLCDVTYRAPSSGNREKTFRVLPLKLLVHNGTLYLHAWQDRFKTVLLLNLQRLRALTPLEETMPWPESYDPDRLERSAFGIFISPDKTERFELEFSERVRPYIEERLWHPDQQLSVLPDGSLRLVFECTPSFEVTNWVAGWQDQVKVLAPQSLRDTLRRYAEWLMTQYPAAPK